MLREIMKDGYGISLSHRKKNINLIPSSYNNKRRILSPNNQYSHRTLESKTVKNNLNQYKNIDNQIQNLQSNIIQDTATTETSNKNQLNNDLIIQNNRLYSPNQKNNMNIINIENNENNNNNKRNIFSDSKVKNSRKYVKTYSSNNKNKSKMLDDTESYYMDKLHTLEGYISLIKNKGVNNLKNEISNKKIKKEKLKNNVDILNSNIRLLNKENKINSNLNNKIIKENENLINSSERANLDSYYLNKELPFYRIEIDNLKMEISKLNEETKYIRNNIIEYEREILAIQDEVKKLNTLNSNLIKDKEKMIPEALKYKNSIEMLESKIKYIDNQSNHFMNNVELLIKENI